jgi:hypothetical protein
LAKFQPWYLALSEAAVHVVDFYLEPEHEKQFQHILTLIKKTDPQSGELLRAYVREAMR